MGDEGQSDGVRKGAKKRKRNEGRREHFRELLLTFRTFFFDSLSCLPCTV